MRITVAGLWCSFLVSTCGLLLLPAVAPGCAQGATGVGAEDDAARGSDGRARADGGKADGQARWDRGRRLEAGAGADAARRPDAARQDSSPKADLRVADSRRPDSRKPDSRRPDAAVVGAYGCASIWGCMGAEKCSDSVCEQRCIAGAAASSQGLYDDWLQCIDNACQARCSDPNSQMCLDCVDRASRVECRLETDACYEDPGRPPYGCLQIIVCANLCAGDSYCIDDCIGNGAADGRAKFQALLNCLDAACSAECNDPYGDCAGCYRSAQESGGACASQNAECNRDYAP